MKNKRADHISKIMSKRLDFLPKDLLPFLKCRKNCKHAGV